MYRLGQGVPENALEAARWYHLAAEQGEMSAALDLADMYFRGEGVRQDYREAVMFEAPSHVFG
jgi:hypothetical protein